MTAIDPEVNATHVAVLHPSFGHTLQWIDDFAPPGSGFVFHKVIPPEKDEISWHSRGAATTAREWVRHFRYALKAALSGRDIVVTNFPPLAFAACFWKLALGRRFRVVAWSFNIGSVASAAKGRVAGFLMRRADLLIVHSREEIARYAAWLGLPEEKFLFVPLQRGVVETRDYPVGDAPFLVSLGSAGRDYRTLFAAVADWPGRAIVVAKPEAVEGLEIPPNVEILNGLSLLDCQSLAARARLGVVPISNLDTASGQVTFLMLMALGVPLIVTDCPGSRDYVENERDALTTPPGDAAALRRAIERVWEDEALRRRLGEAGFASWREKFSDEAAGANFVRALARARDGGSA